MTPPFIYGYGEHTDLFAPNGTHDKERKSLDLSKAVCEYKKLGEIATFTYGYTDKAKDSGNARFIRITDINDDGVLNPKDAKYVDLSPENEKYRVKAGDLLMARTGATFGKTLYVPTDEPAVYASFLIKISLDNSVILNRFYWHFSKSNLYWNQANNLVSKGGQPQFNSNALCRIQIPLPPLPVQQRIVNVLDNFDAICADLKIGLPAEIEARKKQYEYYRDLLLSFEPVGMILAQASKQASKQAIIKLFQYVFGYVEVRLGDVATDIYRGSGITRSQVTENGIPCVRYGEIYTTYGVWFDKCKSHTQLSEIASPKYFEHGDILFAITGESVEDIAKSTAYVGNEKCLAGGDIVVLKHNQNPKYLSYALSTLEAQKQKSKGKIKSKVVHSSVPSISEITIPLPPLSVQECIVKILDRFDFLCNDISAGIPAEIETRKKQYEYYRDLLLNFKKKK